MKQREREIDFENFTYKYLLQINKTSFKVFFKIEEKNKSF